MAVVDTKHSNNSVKVRAKFYGNKKIYMHMNFVIIIHRVIMKWNKNKDNESIQILYAFLKTRMGKFFKTGFYNFKIFACWK